jgi:polyisoprenoid-binding protein YceI
MTYFRTQTLALILAASVFSMPALAEPENYTLDPAHTNVVWSANHFGFSNPSGKFTSVQGTLVLDEAKPEASKVNVTIPLANVLTGVKELDEHLKTEAFFDVAKFPLATFVSDKVDVIDKNNANVHGNLTLHGVTKPVVLEVKLNKIGINPIVSKKTAGFSATITIKRSDFGINYALPGVSDDVKISIESEANIS